MFRTPDITPALTLPIPETAVTPAVRTTRAAPHIPEATGRLKLIVASPPDRRMVTPAIRSRITPDVLTPHPRLATPAMPRAALDLPAMDGPRRLLTRVHPVLITQRLNRPATRVALVVARVGIPEGMANPAAVVDIRTAAALIKSSANS